MEESLTSSTLLAPSPSPRNTRVDYIRQRYLSHLGHDTLTIQGYLPNLLPILRDTSYSPPLATPSPYCPPIVPPVPAPTLFYTTPHPSPSLSSQIFPSIDDSSLFTSSGRASPLRLPSSSSATSTASLPAAFVSLTPSSVQVPSDLNLQVPSTTCMTAPRIVSRYTRHHSAGARMLHHPPQADVCETQTPSGSSFGEIGGRPVMEEGSGEVASSLVSSELYGGEEETRGETMEREVFERNGRIGAPTGERRAFLAAGSVKSSVFNLTSATLGAGALSLPFAIRNTGVLVGVALLIAVGYLSITATTCLINVINYTELKTYEELAVRAGGRRFALAVEFNIIIFCFGVAVGYLISVGDIVETIMKHFFTGDDWWWLKMSRPAVLVVLTICVLLPLCLVERLESLRFTSFMGVLVILFVVVVVTVYFADHGVGQADKSELLFPLDWQAPVRASSLLVFAFSCQANVPGIYCELENQNCRRMVKVSTRSVILCFLTYALMGVCGFLTFGELTKSNILSNFGTELTRNPLIVAAFAAMSLAITFAYPMNIFPCRFSIEMLIFVARPDVISRTLQIFVAFVVVRSVSVVAKLLLSKAPNLTNCLGLLAGLHLPGLCYSGAFHFPDVPARGSDCWSIRQLHLTRVLLRKAPSRKTVSS
eukprot:GHVQ01001036.1.p1 GENE.GHVQ01001036.1~~GHVQ01001036.1.p1  ORF type:complete len:652 (-),score=78.61 GHVQ01001036.1:2762-4717(-)